MQNIIFSIIGPTCVGKTDLSILLAKKYSFDIISMDSSMVYKYMDIGTSKPSKNILSKFKHYLIDICDPSINYSVYNFYYDSLDIIESCFNKNRCPLFVGGTMLYFNLLYKKIYLSNYKFKNNIKFLNFVILPYNENKLFLLIKKRLNLMLKNGFIDEVKFLYNRNNVKFNCNSIRSIGYNEFWLYFDGKLKFKNALDLTLVSTYNLYHKQLSWLKKFQKNIIFLDNDIDKSFIYLDNIITSNLNF